MSSHQEIKVLFICLGNICRSPIAEAVLRHTLKKYQGNIVWSMDSAAIIGYHTGKRPDVRAQKVMKKYSIPMDHRARVVSESDFQEFDYIFGMDDSNMAALHDLAPKQCKAKVELFCKYDPEGVKTIRDPYYDDGSEGFEECYKQVLRCSEVFAQKFY